jgi:hypothetical protein
LGIKKDNKLSEMRTNFSGVLKENVVEQMVRSRNKNKMKLVVKSKEIAKKFNGKCFICNKIENLAKDYKNKGK